MSDGFKENMSQEMSQNFYWGECIDSEDPLMLGRVRVRPLIKNIDQILKSAEKNGFSETSKTPEKNGPWSDLDPLIYLSFLPYFVNQVPKNGERVMIIYFDLKRTTGKNKFYMMAPFSSPTTIKEENYNSSRTHLDDGAQNSKISLPNVKNNNGTYKDTSKSGVFAEPIDVSINGRDTADIIIKKDDILLRAGKHFNFVRNEIPSPNPKRAFLQLSNLKQKKSTGSPETISKLKDKIDQNKYLIEYYCTTQNSAVNLFSGGIYIYKLPETNSYLTQAGVLDNSTSLTAKTSYPLVYTTTIGPPVSDPLPMEEFAKLISDTIRNFHDGPSAFTDIFNGEQFPFFFRPDDTIRETLNNLTDNVDLNSVQNMSKLISLVKVNKTQTNPGYGTVYKNFTTPLPFTVESEVVTPTNTLAADNSVVIMGANKLYLLSHESQVEGKQKIDLSNTIYGISGETIFENIDPNTSGLVRGEPLLELLQIIVNFLITHDHPYPMLPPTPVSRASLISTNDVLVKMQEAYQKVLNSNIRIN
jgi:hypothetical protein